MLNSARPLHMQKGLGWEMAAALPVALCSSWSCLFEHGELKRGQTVLIHGAAGVLILINMVPHTTHTTICVSSYYKICVLKTWRRRFPHTTVLPYVSTYDFLSLYSCIMCSNATIYVSSYRWRRAHHDPSSTCIRHPGYHAAITAL